MSYEPKTLKELAKLMLGSAYSIEITCEEIRKRRECKSCVFNDENNGCLIDDLRNDYGMFDRYDKLKR